MPDDMYLGSLYDKCDYSEAWKELPNFSPATNPQVTFPTT